jgi:hypothetical protein
VEVAEVVMEMEELDILLMMVVVELVASYI